MLECTAPAATPSGTASATPSIAASATATATAAPTVEPTATTLVRTPEPIPTGAPQAAAPSIHVVSQAFAVPTAAPLIEVVGPYRTSTETDLRRWVPSLLEGLDKVRVDRYEASNRALFDIFYAPGPYAELIRQSLAPLRPTSQGEQRKFELGQLTIQHMYASPGAASRTSTQPSHTLTASRPPTGRQAASSLRSKPASSTRATVCTR
jgi:hypothetical protein